METIKAMPIIFLASLCLIILQPIFPGIATAEEDLDRLMEGFEDKPANGSEDTFDNIIEGFEDPQKKDSRQTSDPEESQTREDPQKGVFAVSYNGHASVRSTYNYEHDEPEANETDWRGLSSLRSEVMLEVDTKLGKNWSARISGSAAYDAAYDINGRDSYTDDVQDNYISEVELLETYVQGSLLKYMDVKAGRQVVVWGKLDNLRVTDILNPLDLRVFGATDIEDLRLPVNMLKIDAYLSNWTLTGMAIPEIRFNKNPEYGSDFYPADLPPVHEETPANGLEHMEYAFSVSGVFSGWDIAFYWADVYSDASHLERLPGFFQVELDHARLNLYGAAFDVALGNWLLKSEIAHVTGLKYFNTDDDTYSRTDVGAGIEFSGFSEAILGVEIVKRYIRDYEEILENEPDNLEKTTTQSVARLTKTWLNKTLTLTILASAFGSDFKKGSFQRYELVYDISDDLLVKGGLIAYQSGATNGFGNIGENDRLFLEFKYSF
ncbi:MAG: DUF1302 family protein [Desulfobacterales bacterium]|nr:DUF1302 family protein [Desulfobacterales bacterium]